MTQPNNLSPLTGSLTIAAPQEVKISLFILAKVFRRIDF